MRLIRSAHYIHDTAPKTEAALYITHHHYKAEHLWNSIKKFRK